MELITCDSQIDRVVVFPRGAEAVPAVTDLRILGAPTWSPDGTRLAVAGADVEGDDRLTEVQMHVIGTGGAERRTLASLPVIGTPPRWSPDGRRLSWGVCRPDACEREGIAIADLDDPAGQVEVLDVDATTPLAWVDDTTLLVGEPGGRLAFLNPADGAAARFGPQLDVIGGVDVAADPAETLPAAVARALTWSRQRPNRPAGPRRGLRRRLYLGGAQAALAAPLLLTPGDALHLSVAVELDGLGTLDVVILGGVDAVSPAVETALRGAGRTTTRLARPTRIDTAVAVAEAILPTPSRILLARALGDAADPTRRFADALAGGAAAAGLADPLLLTDTARLSPAVVAYLDRTPSVGQVVVVGGTDAVGEDVVAALAARGLAVVRLAGRERVLLVHGPVVPQPTAGVLARALAGSMVRCASMGQRQCVR